MGAALVVYAFVALAGIVMTVFVFGFCLGLAATIPLPPFRVVWVRADQRRSIPDTTASPSTQTLGSLRAVMIRKARWGRADHWHWVNMTNAVKG